MPVSPGILLRYEQGGVAAGRQAGRAANACSTPFQALGLLGPVEGRSAFQQNLHISAANGLEQIPIEARSLGLLVFRPLRTTGVGEDPRLGAPRELAHTAAGLMSIHAAHLQIHDHRIRVEVLAHAQTCLATEGHPCLVTRLGQKQTEHLRTILIVIYDEDALRKRREGSRALWHDRVEQPDRFDRPQ